MNADNYPDVLTMTVEEAKVFILQAGIRPGDSHDVHLDVVADTLIQAAQVRREADLVRQGVTSRTYYTSSDDPASPSTAILYDAAWELVLEGILRPGPRYRGVLNERSNCFSLTSKGKAKLGR